jgi:hypothetical protein
MHAAKPCSRSLLATLGVLAGLAGLPPLARGEFLARGFTPPAGTGEPVAPDHARRHATLTDYRPHPGVRPAPRGRDAKVAKRTADEEQRRLLMMQLMACTMMIPGELPGYWPPPTWVAPPYVIPTPTTSDTPAGPTGGPTPAGGGEGPPPGGTPTPASTPEPTGLLLGLLGSGLAGLAGWARRRRWRAQE